MQDNAIPWAHRLGEVRVFFMFSHLSLLPKELCIFNPSLCFVLQRFLYLKNCTMLRFRKGENYTSFFLFFFGKHEKRVVIQERRGNRRQTLFSGRLGLEKKTHGRIQKMISLKLPKAPGKDMCVPRVGILHFEELCFKRYWGSGN